MLPVLTFLFWKTWCSYGLNSVAMKMKVDQEVRRGSEKGEEMEDMLVCFGSLLPFTNFYFQPPRGRGLNLF